MVLILGFALAASLGASALVLGEVGQTRIISDSVVAFFAADAGVEQALYQLCQQNNKSDQNSQPVGSAEYAYDITGGGSALKVVSTGSFRASRRAVEVSGFTEDAGTVDCGQAGSGGGSSPSAAAQWKMDETSGTIVADNSVNGNDGTASGATIVDGISGKARSFDGSNDYVDMGDKGVFNMAGDFALEAWIKTSSGGGIITKADNADGRGYMLTVRGSGVTDFRMYNSGGASTCVATGNKSVIDNNWHHIVGVREKGGQCSIYVDGVLDVAAPDNGNNIYYGAIPFKIGCNYDSRYGVCGAWNTEPFNGSIDEVAIYGQILTPVQICSNYEALSGGSPCGTPPIQRVAQWKMDETSGTTVADNSGNGNDGTASGTTIVLGGGIGGSNARSFNGTSDYINVTDSNSLDVTTSFTIAGWFKPSVSCSTCGGVVKHATDGINGAYELVQVSGKWRGVITSNGTCAAFSSNGPCQKVDSSSTYPLGQWQHVALRYNGANLELYINGVLDTSAAYNNASINITTIPFKIGAPHELGLGNFYQGLIDEVNIYNSALSAAQICDNYEALSGGSPCGTPPSAGPIALWKMESSGATIVDSADSHDGTANGTTIVPGISGNARSFNGVDNYISVPHNNIFNFGTENFTASGWFKTSSATGGDDDYGNIISDTNAGGGGEAGYAIQIGDTSNKGKIRFWIWDNAVSAYQVNLFSNNTYDDNSWHFFTAVRSGTTQLIYVDGVLDNSDTGTIRTVNNTRPLAIGAYDPTNGARYFNGLIDEITIYNTALSAAQICDNYKATSGRTTCSLPPPPPVAQWKMDETRENECGAGKDVCDTSVNDNHGDANGASIVTGGGIGGSNARSFDGSNDFVQAGDTSTYKFLHGALDPAGFKFTVAFWMKMNNPNPNAAYGLISTASQGSGTTGITIFYEDRDIPTLRRRSISLFIPNGTGGQWVCDNTICASNANAYPNDSNWHHIAVTFDRSLSSGDAKFYVDGVFAGQGNEGPNGPATGNSSYPLHIGSTGSEALFFPGSMDEVNIFNSAFSDAQVCDLYKTQSGRPSCP